MTSPHMNHHLDFLTSLGVQACLREGMRIFPPVPTLTREAERDMDLGGYRVAKGQMLGVAVYSMHNNPAYWQVCQSVTSHLFRPT